MTLATDEQAIVGGTALRECAATAGVNTPPLRHAIYQATSEAATGTLGVPTRRSLDPPGRTD